MLDFKKIEKFARNLHESIPKIIQDLTYNLDKKINKILHKKINHMNFVNREEFILQSKILLNTQEKIKKLEKKLELLEKNINLNITNKTHNNSK